MKYFFTIFCGLMLGQLAYAQSSAASTMPDAQKLRYCERVRDHAVQAFYNRDKGRPMSLFNEDGSDGARITNVVIRGIYADPKISTQLQAENFGRATCNKMMGTKNIPE
jgi:hypothetical protein